MACELLVVACGISFTDRGPNPDPLRWELRILATSPPGKSQSSIYRYSLTIPVYAHAHTLTHTVLFIHRVQVVAQTLDSGAKMPKFKFQFITC